MYDNAYAKRYGLEYWEPRPFTKEALQYERERLEAIWLDRLHDKQHRCDVLYETTIELFKKYHVPNKLINGRKKL